MRLEYIGNVTDSEVLGKTVFDNDGRILLKSGVKLTKRYIKNLEKLGVYYIYIEDKRLDDVDVEDCKLNVLKQDTVKSLNKVMNNVGMFNKTTTKEYLNRVTDLINYILDDGDINKSLFDIKTYDNYTMIHSVDTGVMAAFMGIGIGLKKNELNDLVVGGILHDVGKVKVPISVIDKKGPLTSEEFEEIKKHPLYGIEILEKNIAIPESALKIVEQHHEKVNGKGYPYGLSDLQINKKAKIVSVCDVYDAVSSDRSYRKRFSPKEAYELILSDSGRSFDEDVVRTFRKVFSVYPLGSCVKLSDGREGYVIKQNENFPDRPIIRMLYDYKTGMPIKFYEIDLLKELNLVIVAVV
ncbi:MULTISPECIES: HD-GYP domain-containing protein [Clostridium]|uniref:HD-GYP domain-containing protein n=1 Tax=Clostridium senegalense TaxID=1465809 RepID=A0A6M0H1T8_9CLOT|nr:MULTISPECIES: HD-GYP domain-containing protein [Clostridium]NEU04740.1 HD-GYP domain-containing protein [Clostridium senegalense]